MSCPNPAVEHLVEILGEAEARSVLRGYLEHTTQQLGLLPTLPPPLQVLVVHGMKGSSSQVGAALYAAQCRAIESQLREEQRLLTADEIEALRKTFAEFHASLGDWK